MKSKRKMIAITVSLLLVIACLAGATVAYFTDTESTKTNTITIGDVEIDMYEHYEEYNNTIPAEGATKLDANDKYYRETYLGTTVDNILPGVTVPKYTYILNTGSNEAFVRFVVTVPEELNPYLELTFGSNYAVEHVGNVYTAILKTPLAVGALSDSGLQSVKLLETLTEDQVADFQTAFNGVGRDFDITVEGHAIQTVGFNGDYEAAFDAFASNPNEK